MRVDSCDELERVYGDAIRNLGQEHPTQYRLCKARLERGPRLIASDAIATRWLRKYDGVRVVSKIESAAHLELWWGELIRDRPEARSMEAAALAHWMHVDRGVLVPRRLCETWKSRDWSTAGKLMVCADVERELGERLRLDEYKGNFADEEIMCCLSSFRRKLEC